VRTDVGAQPVFIGQRGIRVVNAAVDAAPQMFRESPEDITVDMPDMRSGSIFIRFINSSFLFLLL